MDLLKVDVPANATPNTPWRVTRQSRHRYFDVVAKRDPKTGEELFQYQANIRKELIERDSDLWAVILDEVVSVTPISLDLTSRIDLGGKFRELLED